MNKQISVLELVTQGKTSREIAAILDVSIWTVRYYRQPSRQNGDHYTEQRKKIKRKAVDYSGGQCMKCGYHKCIAALSFHHLDPTTKEYTIGSKTLGWQKTKIEVDKTVILCDICHKELHAGLWIMTNKMIIAQIAIREKYEDRPLSEYRQLVS